MPVHKTFSDELWQCLQVASTITDLGDTGPLTTCMGYVLKLVSELEQIRALEGEP